MSTVSEPVVYLVAQAASHPGSCWSVRGIYTSEEAAEAACTVATDWWWPISLDTDLGRPDQVFQRPWGAADHRAYPVRSNTP